MTIMTTNKKKTAAHRTSDNSPRNCQVVVTITNPRRPPHYVPCTGTTVRVGIPKVTTAATRLVPATACRSLGFPFRSIPRPEIPIPTNSVINSPWNISLIEIMNTS